jgi:hypothetical protein
MLPIPATLDHGMSFHRFGQTTASFGYNFKTALDQPLLPSLGLEGLNCHPRQFSADQLDSLEYISKARCRR